MTTKEKTKAKTKAKAPAKTKAQTKGKNVQVKKVDEKRSESFIPSLRHDIEDAFSHVLENWPRPGALWHWPGFDALEEFSLPMPHARKLGLPRVDFSEIDGSYELTAELPGMTEDDVECSLSGKLLTVKGEKREEKVEDRKGFHLQERRFGSFMRSFPLPEDVDAEKIEATVSNGLLKVRMPKMAKKVTSRKINIRKS